jgi:hypothetical protein
MKSQKNTGSNGWENGSGRDNSGGGDGWGQTGDSWGNAATGWGQQKSVAKGQSKGWDDQDQYDDEWDEDEEDEDEWTEAQHAGAGPKQRQNSWGGYDQGAPSKTMTHAYDTTFTQPADLPNPTLPAFEQVWHAFFGRQRKAKERIHWIYSPQKDPRVVAHIEWLTHMEDDIGAMGVCFPPRSAG